MIALIKYQLSPLTEEEKQRLLLLESAYFKSRYNNAFQPDKEQVTHILGWMLDLLYACGEAAGLLLAGKSEAVKPLHRVNTLN